MLKSAVLLLLVICLSQSQIISRNGKIQEMYDKFQTQIQAYDELMNKAQGKIEHDLEMCIHTAKETNCSHLKVWQHERTKHSKNITNLQTKIESHQKTIQSIIKSNQEETHKKAMIIKRLLPELVKAKNDIEYIEGIQFLIQDTYLNIDNKEESILNIFDAQFGNPVQVQLAQMLAKRYDHDPGAHPQQADYLPEKPEEEPAVPKKEFNQGPPLIDEVIFDGHNEHYPQATVRDLFNSLGGASDPVPVADLIPEGVDVPEHDHGSKNVDDIVRNYKEQKAGENPSENLQVVEIQGEFKARIKAEGQELYDKLEVLRKSLADEQTRIAQSVADLEKAILNLHHRHSRQIVQIYIESKRLQREVFEKDDIVLHLDSMIHDCTNLEKKLKNCEENKGLTLAYIQDLQQQKDLNMGILKELQKLHQFPDKNIDTPIPPVEEVAPTSSQAEAIKKEIEDSQKEMHQIADAEAEVTQEAEAAEAAVPVEEAPVEEAPVKEAPVEEAPVEEAPVEEAPVEEAPVEGTQLDVAPTEAPVEQAPVEEVLTGDEPGDNPPPPGDDDVPTIPDTPIIVDPQPEIPTPPEPEPEYLIHLRKNKKAKKL